MPNAKATPVAQQKKQTGRITNEFNNSTAHRCSNPTRVRTTAKCAYYHRLVLPSVRPHVSARLPGDWVPWNLLLGSLWKRDKKFQIWLKLGKKYRAPHMHM